ncbi:hypothetical protein EDB83DRAFT_1153408 [Lactarius deliciosus]|nr:hypothetical protein EDB83DRAFT_1153408 [Lactarius deliciosus]
MVWHPSRPHRALRSCPGGRGVTPIIRNVLDLQCKQWPKFTECRKQYGQWLSSIILRLFVNLGDPIYLNALGQPRDVLNSQEVAANLVN